MTQSIIFLGFVILCIAMFSGYLSASATSDVDSPYPVGNKNYANTALTGITQVVCTKYGGDADHDGICDDWETQPHKGTNFFGLWINFTYNNVRYEYKLTCDPSLNYTLDYTGLGVCPSPKHKDVYVEVDWMKHHDITPLAIRDTTNAFGNATVQNIDGTSGINLHVQYGEKPNDGNTTVYYTNMKYYSTSLAGTYVGLTPFKQTYFGTVAERTSTDPAHAVFCVYSNGTSEPSSSCLTAKRFAFHYAIFANYLYGSPTTSGYSEQVGNDMIISLGAFTDGKGSVDEQESTFMHELGHNLGLDHGGTQAIPTGGTRDDVSCKPNYFSIMSPTFEYRNFDQCRPLDYSRAELAQLDENGISSNFGISSYSYPSPDPDPQGSSIGTCNNDAHNGKERPFFYNYNGIIYSAPTNSLHVNWNQVYTTVNYKQNLNSLGITGCQGSLYSILQGSNDWNSLNLVFVNKTQNFNAGTVPVPEPGQPPLNGDEGFGDYYGIGQELTSNEAKPIIIKESYQPSQSGPDYLLSFGLISGGIIGGGIMGWFVRNSTSKR